MIKLESLQSKNKKRPGRGLSAGQGKTAGRGTKGQKSRSGFNIPNRFEGGQTPLSMRLPKLPGFRSKNQKMIVITLDTISKNFKDKDIVSIETLTQKKLVKVWQTAKILNSGELKVKVTLSPEIVTSKSVKELFNKAAEKPSASAPVSPGESQGGKTSLDGKKEPAPAKTEA